MFVAGLRRADVASVLFCSLKCASISHDRLTTVIDLVKVRNLSVTDYIGWHPGIESPNVRCSAICPICSIRNAPELEQCARCHRRLQFPSVYMKYASAILAAFYAGACSSQGLAR